jgi:hypothetical protein
MRISVGRSMHLKHRSKASTSTECCSKSLYVSLPATSPKKSMSPSVVVRVKFNPVVDCFRVPSEQQTRRRSAQTWLKRRKNLGQAHDVALRARVNNVDIERDARRSVQNRRHSTDQDKIHFCVDQRRNDLREINGHHFFVAPFCPPELQHAQMLSRALFEAQLQVSRNNVRSTSHIKSSTLSLSAAGEFITRSIA